MFDSLRYSKAAIKSPKETAAPLETQGWCLYAAYQAPWYLRVTLRVIAAMNACSQTRNTSNASPSKQPGAESDANCWKNIPKDASALLNLSKKETAQRGACEILWGGLCQRFPPQIPSPKLPSSSPVHLVNTFCKKNEEDLIIIVWYYL